MLSNPEYMKYPFLSLFLLLIASAAQAQKPNFPEFSMPKQEPEFQLRFLSANELGGRRTGSMGNNLAARFIAEELRTYGYSSPAGAKDYFQPIQFQAATPPSAGTLKIGKVDYKLMEDFIFMTGEANTVKNAEVMFIGHGWVDEKSGHDDYKGKDVKGKLLISLPGPPGENNSPMVIFRAMGAKRDLAYKNGAVGLIELYRLPFPWNFFSSYFGRETIAPPSKEAKSESRKLTYGWMKEKSGVAEIKDLQAGKKIKASFSSNGFSSRNVPSQNVIGVLEGSDPELKKEYLLITAHYDHVGIGKEGGNAYSAEDSIFNGARDNAMGTVALLSAAKALSIQRPKRSVIVMAVTGEELGLLGSAYYAQNPLIPLKEVIFDLNTDGAGYNSTEHISIFGYGRTGTDAHVETALNSVGLKVFPDPAPEQGLFDRSDNVSFAAEGVPAMNVSPGLTKFDDAINKYYHQVADEASSIDMDYFLKYCQAFSYLARLIANDASKPQWKAGDKYEKAGMELYKK